MSRSHSKTIFRTAVTVGFAIFFAFSYLPKGSLFASAATVPPVAPPTENTPTSDHGGPTAADAPGAPTSDHGGPTTPEPAPYDPAHPTVNQGVDIIIRNPLKAQSLTELITMVIKLLIELGIPVAILFIIYAGFKYVTARGKPDAIKEAHAILLWTVVGIAVLLGSMVIAEIVKNTIEAVAK